MTRFFRFRFFQEDRTTSMKHLLILGSGLVARPFVKYFGERPEVHVTLASLEVERARDLAAPYPHIHVVHLDAQNAVELGRLIAEADVVASLLPAGFHEQVARMCIERGRSMVMLSYRSPALQQLDAEARRRRVTILTEIGLDPGIDHLIAVRTIQDVHRKHGRVELYESFAGGLPAPASNNNPWQYKFSWSPRGVLQAGTASAVYLRDGRRVEVAGANLFAHTWPLHIAGMAFEAYPNRDATRYIEAYGIPEVRTMIRGSLRYPGWCGALLNLARLGLLSEQVREGVLGISYRQLMCRFLDLPPDADPRREIADRLGIGYEDEFLHKLDWLGVFDDTAVDRPAVSPLDFLSQIMAEKMRYAPGEQDMVLLVHRIEAVFPDHREVHESILQEFGEVGGDSAMARTVSLPAAIATRLLIEDRVPSYGVLLPVFAELVEPILAELQQHGIEPRETVSRLPLSPETGPVP